MHALVESAWLLAAKPKATPIVSGINHPRKF
jgi:hypothetical protein